MEVALGIDDVRGAFAPFADPVIYLILASLFLAEALRKHGLTRRFALYAIVFSRGDLHRLVLILIAMTALLSMWVLNTATAAMLIPVAMSIAQQVRDATEAKRILAVLVLAIGYGASIGGIGTPMGSGENAIASGQLNQVMYFGFFPWLVYGLPVVLVLIPITWLMLTFVFRLPKMKLETTPALRELVRARRLSGAEREILGVLGLSIVLWVGGTAIETLAASASYVAEQCCRSHPGSGAALNGGVDRLERPERRQLGDHFRDRSRARLGRRDGQDRRQRMDRQSRRTSPGRIALCGNPCGDRDLHVCVDAIYEQRHLWRNPLANLGDDSACRLAWRQRGWCCHSYSRWLSAMLCPTPRRA